MTRRNTGVLQSLAGVMACVFLLSGAVHAAQIEKILVRSASGVPVSDALVLANMNCTPGSEFSPETLSEDIKRLFRAGQFEDVRTEVANTGGDKVVITVTVVLKRKVREIIVEGCQQVRSKRVLRGVKQEAGAILDEAQLVADTNEIRRLYNAKGYHQTEVECIIQEIPNTREVNVVFRINEVPRARLQRVRFEGNTVFSDRELRREVKTKRSLWSRIFRIGGYFDALTVNVDTDALRSLYTGRGYLDFEVTDVERIYNQDRTRVTIVFSLAEGQPYTVSSVQVVGAQRFSPGELLELVRLKPETTFNAELERADVERLRRKYEPLGYLNLRCYPVRTPDSSNHRVAIEYRISEGVPVRIRDIYISGNEVTKDRVIRRELMVHPGDLGDAGKIRTSESRLNNMNYFETVEVSHVATETEDEKDLLIRVEEKRTGQLQLGAGFSSEDAILGFVEVTQSNFDWRNWPTFRGGGQRLRLRTQLGTERTDVLLSFTEPWWLERRLRLDLDAYHTTRYQGDYEQQTIGAGASVTQPWLKYWRRSVGLTLQQIRLSDFDDDVSQEMRAEEGTYNADTITFRLIRDTRDHFMRPTRGSQFSISTALKSEVIGSYTNMAALNLSAAKYFPVFGASVLKLRVDAGVCDKITGDPVAIFDRYFAGGAYSVRGFERRDISPVDAVGDAIGGQSLLTGSVELIHPLLKRIYGTVFCDGGNVWENASGLNPGELNISVGIGLQIDLPIGPIRFDYGWPVSTELEHLDDGDGEFHFHLGYGF